MTERSVAIIGGGLAGLSAGCYARMNGYKSVIFEHHTSPGGVVATWKRNGFIIDGGVHFWMDYKPGTATHELFGELGILDAVSFTNMETYLRFVDEETGRRVDICADLDRTESDLCALAPSDARIIKRLISAARKLRGLDLVGLGMADPPQLRGFTDKLKLLWRGRTALRFMSGRYNRPMTAWAGECSDPWMRFVLERLFLPDVPAWFVIMLLAMTADRRLGMLNGVSGEVVEALVERYVNLGGELRCGAEVTEILTNGDRAAGVRSGDGTEHPANVVISAADGYSTLFTMLDEKFRTADLQRRYERMALIPPLVMVSFGVDMDLSSEPYLSVFRLQKPFHVGNRSVDGTIVRVFDDRSSCAPPGAGVLQVTFESQWDYWAELRNDPPAYRHAKERVATEILDRLSAHYPGLRDRVKVTDTATPHTWRRYTRNRRGAYMGPLPTPEVLGSEPQLTLPDLDDFFMAGQWAMPGGGVQSALFSGRHVVRLLCAADGKRFQSYGNRTVTA